MKVYKLVVCYMVMFLPIVVSAQEIPGQYILQWDDPMQTTSSMERYLKRGEVEVEITTKDDGRRTLSLISYDSLAGIQPSSFYVGDFVARMDVNLADFANDSVSYFAILFAHKDSVNYYRLMIKPVEGAFRFVLESVQHGEKMILEEFEVDQSFLPESGWFNLGLRHNILEGSVLLWLHTTKSPLMKVMTRKLVLGTLVFESFGSHTHLDNLKIFAPTMLNEMYD